ncbi:MAG TPA: hypothetical protein VJT08_08285 [Terriglobales bacterium]|nr:hypothetical protein [Terriglobales bacterium]
MKVLLRSSLLCLVWSSLLLAQTSSTHSTTTTSKKAMARRRPAPVGKSAGPSLEQQLIDLRQVVEQQQQRMQRLENELAARDQQIQQAQQAAADANGKATEASTKASEAQTANTDATTQVATLKETVSSVQASNQTLSDSIKAEQKKANEAVENPSAIRFKGITISPTGSFIEAATVWREKAMGDDINTQFSAIPFSGATNANLSELNFTGRQSRIALLGEGKTGGFTFRGYWEMDWLGAGVTSNNNQSNSYVNRQRQLFGQIQTDGGWIFTAGQQWSLATETKTLLDNRTENLPMSIDPQYTVGFTWARQGGVRIVKDFGKKAAIGFSLESPQTLNVGGGGLSSTTGPGVVFQVTGQTGGLLNNGGNTAAQNYSMNYFPDVIGKLAFEPGWGHYELFGIARFFRDRVYPNAGTKSIAGVTNLTNNGGGVGGNLRVPTFKKHVDFGVHALVGAGVGRYGSTTLADVTFKPDGSFEPIRGGSALGTMEIHATKKMDVYFNYGMDYNERALYNAGTLGYGRPTLLATGCNVEVAPAAGGATAASGGSPANCTLDTRNLQEFTAGYWYDFYRGAKGRVRQSFQFAHFTRDTWAGTGGSPDANNNMFWTAFRYYLP